MQPIKTKYSKTHGKIQLARELLYMRATLNNRKQGAENALKKTLEGRLKKSGKQSEKKLAGELV